MLEGLVDCTCWKGWLTVHVGRVGLLLKSLKVRRVNVCKLGVQNWEVKLRCSNSLNFWFTKCIYIDSICHMLTFIA